MKKLLGLLFCFGFLLFAGSIDTSAQNAGAKETISLEISKTQESIAPVLKTIAFDASKPRQAYIQTVRSGLFSSYRLVPDCPVYIINKRDYRYYYSYLSAVSSKYNQPQSYRYSCQRSYNI